MIAVARRMAGLQIALMILAASGAAHADPKSTDPVDVPAGDYVLDPRHVSLIARVQHLGGFSWFTMRFDKLNGAFSYDPGAWATTRATIQVDPASVDTNVPGFDKTVAGLLDAPQHPVITFVAERIEPQGEGAGKLTGQLTFHGVTRPLTLDVRFNGVGPGLLGAGTRVGFSGSGRIRRSDFGATAVRQFAGDDVDLQFDVEFTRK